jgi:hypothetical protein
MAGEQKPPEEDAEFEIGRRPAGDHNNEPEFRQPLNPSLNGAADHELDVPPPIEERSEYRNVLEDALDNLTYLSATRLAHGQRQIELRAFGPGLADVRRLYVELEDLASEDPDEIFRVRAWLDAMANEGQSVEHVMNPHERLAKGASANWQRTTGVIAFWLQAVLGDLDEGDVRVEADRLIERAPIEPSEVITAGANVYMLWYMDDVVIDRDDVDPSQRQAMFAEMQMRIQAHEWGMPVLAPGHARSQGISRYLNALMIQVNALVPLPGTWCYRRGTPRSCEIVFTESATYSLAEVRAAFPPPGDGPQASTGLPGDDGGDHGPWPRHPWNWIDALDRESGSTSGGGLAGEGRGHAAADGAGPAGDHGIEDAPSDSANRPTRRRARRWEP